MKLTKSKLKEIIREELLNEAAYNELPALDRYESQVFDVIIQFKEIFDKTQWKKNRKIQAIIKQMLKLERKLGDAVGELE
jgi:hypothetical protein